MLSRLTSLKSALEKSRNKTILIGSVSTAAIAIVLSRILGLGPRVMSDEFIYSLHSRLLPLSESPVPNYLYLLVFRTTNICGPEFYTCARLINVFFLACLAFFVFLITLRFAGWLNGLLIALLTFAGPLSMYTANFMPDTMFFAGVAGFLWLYLRLTDQEVLGTRSVILLGLAVGVISLVKPHGLFLLVVPAVHLGLGLFQRQASPLGTTLKLGLVAGSALAVKLGIGVLVAGPSGLALFRSAYGSGIPALQPRVEQGSPPSLLEGALLVSENIQGLLLASVLLFLVPISFAIWIIFSKSIDRSEAEFRLALAILSLHVVFVFAVANFVAQVGLFDDSQQVRSQIRYFEFVFAFYPILLVSVIHKIQIKKRLVTAIVTLAALLLTVIWWSEFSSRYLAVYSDSTFNSMTSRAGQFGTVAVVTAVVIGLMWALYPRAAGRAWLYLLLPYLSIIAIPAISADESIKATGRASYESASSFAKGVVDFGKGENLAVIGPDKRELDTTRFLIGEPTTKRKVLSSPDEINLENLFPKTEWLLVFGSQRYFAESTKVFEGLGWQLIRRDLGNNSFLDLGELGRGVRSVFGFENRKTLGLWTNSEFAVISLYEPVLQSHFVQLKLSATQELVGQSVFFSLGTDRIEVPIRQANQIFDITLQFENPELASDLVIEMPVSEGESTVGSLQVAQLIIDKP